MTVIAFDGLTLAADSAMDMGDGTMNRVAKIGMVEPRGPVLGLGFPNVFLFGVAGEPHHIIHVHRFLSGEVEKLDLKGKSEALIVSAEGAWIWTGDCPVPLIGGAKAAIGSGAAAALGAMFAGAHAARAVEIATATDTGCEGPVQAFTLPGPVEQPEVAEPVELKEAGS